MFKLKSWSQVHFFLLVPLLALISVLLISKLWPLYPVQTHLIIELLCIVMGGMIFVLIWFSYDKIPESYRLLGFAYLIIVLLYAVHAGLYVGNSTAEEKLSLNLVMIARVIEALAFFSITFNIPLRLNKLIALSLTLLVGGAIIFTVVTCQIYLPVLYTSSGYTNTKIGLEIAVLLLLLINIYCLRKKIYTRDVIAYHLIFAAILIDVLLTLFFLSQKEPDATHLVLGHLLKNVFYFHLFKGIFVSAITYPYEKLEDVLLHLPLAVVTYDHNQQLTCANKKAEEITGLNFAEVKGFSQKQIVEKMFQNQAPLEFDMTLALRNEVKEKIVTIKNPQDELVKIVVDAYKLQSGGYLCIFDTANKVQEIQNLRLQTQTILNALHNFVFIIDINQTVIMCNSAFCETVEMSTQDIIGLSAFELNEKISITPASLALSLEDSNILENPQEVSIMTPTGKAKNWLMQLAIIKNLNDEVIGGICVGSDITNLKKEQAESQQQEKLVLLGQMATGIVHEIRNPITAIMGFIQILNIKLQDNKLQEYCQY